MPDATYSMSAAPDPVSTIWSAAQRPDGVVECRGDYATCFNWLQTAMIQTGGTLRRENAVLGVLEGVWKTQGGTRVRVTGTVRRAGALTEVTLEGESKGLFATRSHIKETKDLILQTFMQNPSSLLPRQTAPAPTSTWNEPTWNRPGYAGRNGNDWGDPKADKRASWGFTCGLISLRVHVRLCDSQSVVADGAGAWAAGVVVLGAAVLAEVGGADL